MVDHEDITATAWKNLGWIEIRLGNAVGIPVLLMLGPSEPLLLVIVPERREKLLQKANSDLRREWVKSEF